MSDPRDKPADPDPDATVTMPARKAAPKDEDATVMMPSRKALEQPDDDATVTMTSLKGLRDEPKDAAKDAAKDAPARPVADEDATVRMPPGGLKPPSDVVAEAAAAQVALGRAAPAAVPAAFRTETDPEATVIATSPTPPLSPPPDIITEPSRMPMIAGGIVVLLVVLYFALSGGNKKPAPGASDTVATATTATPAPVAAPAASPAPVASAESTSSTPAAASPAAPMSPAATAAPAASTADASASEAKLKQLLAADLKRGSVAVSSEGGATRITFAESHQFGAGDIDPEAKLRPELLRVAAALDKVPGVIVVTGHADATPNNNPKFPSNQELSAARAAAAAKVMAAKLRDPKRITSEGASDTKPLAPGSTPEIHARNRRVEITLKPAP